MDTRIGIIQVPVSCQERAKAFYARTLGFHVISEQPLDFMSHAGLRWVQLEPPQGGTTISLVTWHPTMAPGSLTGLTLETDDIEATHRSLAKAGLHISPITLAPWGACIATFRDPDGNHWLLQQPRRTAAASPPSRNEPRSVVRENCMA
ncbi:conserved protein of unknown function (plasmid) [Rhodovastum atsumiense]|uniref:VOC family protein n=1 Tax=Rhodovastum atsumiense TaxID=504468 RepID=UPI002024198D|nr:VOC family protein [Rhodovastum atsumiense]CAH2605603.1 conserved protein of unknown function [Rhodovastum atsumiense]